MELLLAISFNRVSFMFSLNNFALEINGSTVATSSSGDVAPLNKFTKLNFDGGDGSSNMGCYAKCVAVFLETLTTAQRQQLTTI